MKAQGCFYVLLPYSLPYFLKQDLSMNLELSILATLIDGEAPGPTHLCSPALGVQMLTVKSGFYVGAEDMNSGPHAGSEPPLSPQISLILLLLFFPWIKI